MKVVIPGGSGHVGAVLIRHFQAAGHEVVVLSRSGRMREDVSTRVWDGETLGPWAEEIDGADVVINLAGRSVDCRYNSQNLADMMKSRIDSTRVVGQAIVQAAKPPRLWLQASTATIYAHTLGPANDEVKGKIGVAEDQTPLTWQASVAIAKAWELELDNAPTRNTRKVAMRSAMTMSVDKGSVFDVLATLTRRGLGGRLGSGHQYVSWLHELDFARAVDFLIADEDLSGPINLCSPYPLPQHEFMKILRRALRVPFGLPAPAWMVEIGTWLMRTESELVLKSRRVFPLRLLQAGFKFEYPEWEAAARELVSRR